jgi:hypothetical protein
MPVELFVEVGPIWEIGRGRLSSVLNVGVATEVGAKNYVYDSDKLAACIGSLAYEYQINQGRSQNATVVHHNVTDVLDFVERQYVRVGVSREWYYRGDDIPESWRYVLGVDAAGRLGHGREHFSVAPSAGNVGATVLRIVDITDIIPCVSVGAHFGVVIPRQRFDVIVAGHLDYQHAWTRLVDNDKHLDELVLLLSTSIRY